MVKLCEELCDSLNPSVLESLRAANIRTAFDFVVRDADQIANKIAVHPRVTFGIRNVLIAKCASPLVSCKDLYLDNVMSSGVYATGFDCLDHLLEGGILDGEIMEIFGSSRTGKTQLCFRMAALNALMHEYCVLLVDSFGTHSVHRILQVINNLPFSEKKRSDAMALIHHVTCYDAQDLLRLIQHLRSLPQGDFSHPRPRMLIIDSIASLLQPLINATKKNGQGLINHVASHLKSLSIDTNIAIVITNSIVHLEKGLSRPSLGKYWSYVATIHVTLACDSETEGAADGDESGLRITATVTKCPRVPTYAKCKFVMV